MQHLIRVYAVTGIFVWNKNKIEISVSMTKPTKWPDSDQPGHPVWSQSSRSAQWVAEDPMFLHTDSEDCGLSLRWVQRSFCLFYREAAHTVTEFELFGLGSRGSWRTDYLSHLVTKPTKWVWAQQRLRSAWASAQSEQSLCCPHEESLDP